MSAPSNRMMRLVREMVDIAATDWSEDEVDNFLDLISPSLRRHLLLDNLSHRGYSIVLDNDAVYLQHGRQKINAIKEVRASTGLGLKEAKDILDAAEQVDFNKNKIPDYVTNERRDVLARNLMGTGYRLE